MKYAFYVSGNAGRLRKLIELKSKILVNTVVVITESSKLLELKDKLSDSNIDLVFYNFTKGSNLDFSDFILSQFEKCQVDYCFCFGDNILKGELLRAYNKRIINFHPSILPMFPGRKSIDQAMNNNSTILLGNTAHFIDEGIDTGPIILQTVVSKSYMNKDDYNKILDIQIDMIELIFDYIENDNIVIVDSKVLIKSDKSKITPSFHFNVYE
jgi:phosphoribosylglycinamide formyltransferase-1